MRKSPGQVVSAWRAVSVALPAVLVALLGMQVRGWWDPSTDVTCYFSMVRGVAEGRGWQNLGRPELHYALGYPLLIVPAFWVKGWTFWVISAIRLVVALATLGAVYVWARGVVSRAGALLLMALVGLNTSYWNMYQMPLSDLPGMMWMFWAAIAAQRMVRKDGRVAWGWAATCMGLFAVAVLTRQSVLVLAGGIGLVLLAQVMRKRLASWKAAVLVALMALPPAVIAYATTRPSGGTVPAGDNKHISYVEQFRVTEGYGYRLLDGLHLRVNEAARMVVPFMTGVRAPARQWLDWRLLMFGPLCGLMVWGWWKLLRRRGDALLAALPLYVGLYVWWPFDQGTRYLAPMLPVFLVALWPWFRGLGKWRWALAAGICALHLIAATASLWKEVRHVGREYAVAYPALVEMAQPVGHELTAARGTTENVRLWMQYLTDRYVVPVEGDVPSEVVWVVQPAGKEAPMGFEGVREAGELRLWRRR